MKKLVDFRILCLGALVITSGCSLDSLGSTQYLDGVNRNTLSSVVTNVFTNIVTNQVTNNVNNNVTNIVTNVVISTNTSTNTTSATNNVLTNVVIVVTNTVTNVITNEPVDNRPDLEKFMYAFRGKDIKISDNFGIDSFGSFSTDGYQLHTNLRTSVSLVNAHSTAAAVLYTGVTTYNFESIKDTGGYKATYYGEAFDLKNITLYFKTTVTLTITLNSNRTGGTISSYKTIYGLLSGSIMTGYPQSTTTQAKFTIIDRQY